MQLERQTDYFAGCRCVEVGVDGGQRTVAELTGRGAIAIAERSFSPAIAALLPRIDLSKLKTIRLAGSAETIRRRLLQRLQGEAGLPPVICGWLSDDADELMRMFTALSGAHALLVRLEAVANDGCSRFHADNVRYRLVTTYRGAGTEWLPPPYPEAAGEGCIAPTGRVERLETGWIAVMRGRKMETGDMLAILHRSPPMQGIEQPRLFLTIDDLSDHALVAADNL
jgi:hypothetical protein